MTSYCDASLGKRRDSGAAAVEFAIILPLLLLVVAGIVDFGRAYFTQVTLTNAVREGARAAVVGVAAGSVEQRALAAIPEPLKSATSVPPVACGSPNSDVTVTATADFEWLILEPILNLFGGIAELPDTLSSEATMRCGG